MLPFAVQAFPLTGIFLHSSRRQGVFLFSSNAPTLTDSTDEEYAISVYMRRHMREIKKVT